MTAGLQMGVVLAALAGAPAAGQQSPATPVENQLPQDAAPEGASSDSAWTLLGRFDQGFDTNLAFREPPSSGPVERLGVNLSRSSRGGKGQSGLSIGGRLRLYPNARSLDGVDWNVDGSTARQIRTRLQLRGTASRLSSYAQESPLLMQSGLLVETARTHTSRVSGGFAYGLSARTSIASDLSYDRVSFSSPAVTNAETASVSLRDGSLLSFTTALQQAVGTQSRVEGLYGYNRSMSTGLLSEKHALQARWMRRLSNVTTVELTGGAGVVIRSLQTSVIPDVAARLSTRLGRGTLDATYAHSMGQAFGSGRDRAFDAVTGRFGAVLGRRLQLSASTMYTRGHTLDALDAVADESVTGRLGISVTLSRRASLDGSYAADHRFSAASWPATTRHLFTVSISHAHAWE